MKDISLEQDFATRRLKKKATLTHAAFGKLPPQNIEMEQAVLGAVLLEKDKLADVTEILPKPECFYVDSHQKIYACILELLSEAAPIDMLTVTEALRKKSELEQVGGAFFIAQLTNKVISSANVTSHARIVMEKFIQRELIRVSGTILGDAYEDGADIFDLLDKAETELFEISNNYMKNDYKDIGTVLIDTLQHIEEARNRSEEMIGTPTGFGHLDHLTAGWQKTDLIILAARPSVGKTAFALNLAINAALDPFKPTPVAFFSLEMSNDQLVRRLLSMVTEVPLRGISRGQLTEREFQQMVQRADRLSKSKLFLDDQAGLNIFELRAKCRRLKDKHDIGLIVIDYLQLMQAPSGKGGNREQEIAKISRELKGLAKDLQVPIIALSQLSRALETRGEKNKMPQLSDLRESGAIEQDADMVMFLYRPEYHGITANESGESNEGLVVLNVAKHRNGSLDHLNFRSDLTIQKFYEASRNDPDFGGQGLSQNNFSGNNNNFSSSEKPSKGLKNSYGDNLDETLRMDDSFEIKASKFNTKKWDDAEGSEGDLNGSTPF